MFRSGFIALVGLPNAGKSTLCNLLVGEKVAIVTPKPQTTRRRISGIVSGANSQIIFVDSPGVLEHSSSDLNKFLIHEYQDVLANSDGAFALVSAEEAFTERSEKIVNLVEKSGKPWALLITKADLIDEETHHRIMDKYKGTNILFISVTKNPNHARSAVQQTAELLIPESPKLYKDDLFTTESLRDMAAEIVREKCFLNLHQEIPFGLAIKITSFHEDKNLTRIEADILIDRESHKKIVIGQKGSSLKKIGMEARTALETLLGSKVYLGLHVVCKPKWMQDQVLMRELGYVQRD